MKSLCVRYPYPFPVEPIPSKFNEVLRYLEGRGGIYIPNKQDTDGCRIFHAAETEILLKTSEFRGGDVVSAKFQVHQSIYLSLSRITNNHLTTIASVFEVGTPIGQDLPINIV